MSKKFFARALIVASLSIAAVGFGGRASAQTMVPTVDNSPSGVAVDQAGDKAPTTSTVLQSSPTTSGAGATYAPTDTLTPTTISGAGAKADGNQQTQSATGGSANNNSQVGTSRNTNTVGASSNSRSGAYLDGTVTGTQKFNGSFSGSQTFTPTVTTGGATGTATNGNQTFSGTNSNGSVTGSNTARSGNLSGGNNTLETNYSTPDKLFIFGGASTPSVNVPGGTAFCNGIGVPQGASGGGINLAGWIALNHNRSVIEKRFIPLVNAINTCANLQNAKTASEFSQADEMAIAFATAGTDCEAGFKIIVPLIARNGNPGELRDLYASKKQYGCEKATQDFMVGLATKNRMHLGSNSLSASVSLAVVSATDLKKELSDYERLIAAARRYEVARSKELSNSSYAQATNLSDLLVSQGVARSDLDDMANLDKELVRAQALNNMQHAKFIEQKLSELKARILLSH